MAQLRPRLRWRRVRPLIVAALAVAVVTLAPVGPTGPTRAAAWTPKVW